jgi:hypothetical protein
MKVAYANVALVAGLLFWLVAASTPVYAQEAEEVANWAFATWIGTGVYRLEDRELKVFRVPIAFGVPKNEERKFKVKVLLPVTLGVENFEFDIDNPELAERLETITFVPGAEVEVPILKNWSLKPFGQAGIGKDFSGGDFVYLYSIYSIGLKSLATFPWRKYTFGLGNRVMGAGQTVSGGGNGKVSVYGKSASTHACRGASGCSSATWISVCLSFIPSSRTPSIFLRRRENSRSS